MVISMGCSICHTRERRHWAMPLWPWARPTRNISTPETLKYWHKHWFNLQHNTGHVPNYGGPPNPNPTRHLTDTMEPSTMVGHSQIVPTCKSMTNITTDPWIPVTQCQHNCYIVMEEILGLNFPKQQTSPFHSMQLYLSITTISEITDNTGYKLLPMSHPMQHPDNNWPWPQNTPMA